MLLLYVGVLDYDVDDYIDEAHAVYKKQCDLGFGKKFGTDGVNKAAAVFVLYGNKFVEPLLF